MNLKDTAHAIVGASAYAGGRATSVAIIPSHETLVPMNELPKILPPRPNGKRVHISACYRWAGRGVRGVKLEVVRIGGSTYTSREALARFSAQLSSSPAAPSASITQRREQQIEQAEVRLKAMLGRSIAKGK